MAHVCAKCSRLNPADASFCYHDGAPLNQHAPRSQAVRFPVPFVFPSGYACSTFDEFAVGCQQNWADAREMLRRGYFETLMVNVGRGDLAMAASTVGKQDDHDLALDQFLARLPSNQVNPPKLLIEPAEINLGRLTLAADQRFSLRIRNQGMRLLQGVVIAEECAWLAVGDGPASSRKLFRCEKELSISVQVRVGHLRAGHQPMVGQLTIDSNGGTTTVAVRVQVPVQPFPTGVLAGATSPRELAHKARSNAPEAGKLIEDGTVKRWFNDNGWVYPVRGPTASGVAAVQQMFEALGLVQPPKVELSEDSVRLHGRPNESLEHVLSVLTHENRLVVAHGKSDQPWLLVGPAIYRGRMSHLPLTVASVPAQPGQTLAAQVKITANGGQQFRVPVSLVITEPLPFAAQSASPVAVPTPRPVAPAPPVGKPVLPKPVAPKPPPVPVAKPFIPPAMPKVVPVAKPVAPPPVAVAAPQPAAPKVQVQREPDRVQAGPASDKRSVMGILVALAPAFLLVLTLVGIVLRDYLQTPVIVAPHERPVDLVPRIEIRFHDKLQGDDLEAIYLRSPQPTMRFGIIMLADGKLIGDGLAVKRLTFDPWGRTNNACLRFDGSDQRLFGGDGGTWREFAGKGWKDAQGQDHDGTRSVWICEDLKLQVTQLVELVAGEQSKLRDTCRVRYLIENQDGKSHQVGLRFLLDTYIGGNDGVPFTIPGATALCDTMIDLPKQSPDKKMPDFLQALEKPDLGNPGTVAHLKLKLDNLEPPVRVTLGAWPDESLRVNNRNALGPLTLWDVPLLSIKSLKPPDSAVAIYWAETELKAGASREVGFEYGLFPISSTDSRLAVAVDGARRPQGELTVVAYVNRTGLPMNASLTLTLPDGFALLEGAATQMIPEPAKAAPSAIVPLTWKVQAGDVGKYIQDRGIKVTASTGQSQTVDVEIKRTIFD